MGKFSKHLGEGEKVMIDGEEFILKPLGIDYAGHFLKIAKGFSGSKDEGDIEGMFKNFTDETVESMKIVTLETLKQSYPGEPEDELKQFAGKYLIQLFPIIQKLNQAEGDNRKEKALGNIDKLKAKLNKDGPEQSDKQ